MKRFQIIKPDCAYFTGVDDQSYVVDVLNVPGEFYGRNDFYAVYKNYTVLLKNKIAIRHFNRIIISGNYVKINKNAWWHNHILDKRCNFISLDAIESVLSYEHAFLKSKK